MILGNGKVDFESRSVYLFLKLRQATSLMLIEFDCDYRLSVASKGLTNNCYDEWWYVYWHPSQSSLNSFMKNLFSLNSFSIKIT